MTVNGKTWTRDREVRRALEYDKTAKTEDIVKRLCGKENYAQKHQLSSVPVVTLVDYPKDSRKDDYYIIEEGTCELLVASQQPFTKELAKWMGIKIIGHKHVRKEARTIYTMQNVFEWVPMK